MDEKKLGKAMLDNVRAAAKLGMAATPNVDKKKKQRVKVLEDYKTPLNKRDLHVLLFMREHGVISAEELAGAMDEELTDMRKRLMRLIDEAFVRVISDGRGYAKYKARNKREL